MPRDMSGVRALLLPLRKPATFLEQHQQSIQEHLFCTSLNQTCAKIREKSKVETGIGEV